MQDPQNPTPPIAAPDAAYAQHQQPVRYAPEEGDTTGGIIPYKNPKALLAYYLGLFSLLPCLGLGMAPAALVLGIQGLGYARQHPVVKGQVHAWVGIVCGALWTLVHWVLLLMLVAGMIFTRR